MCYADYSDPAVLNVNLPQIGKFASTWLLNPLGAALISFVIVTVANKLIIPRLTQLSHYDLIVKIGYFIAGGLAC